MFDSDLRPTSIGSAADSLPQPGNRFGPDVLGFAGQRLAELPHAARTTGQSGRSPATGPQPHQRPHPEMP